jgi:hypothetical protein
LYNRLYDFSNIVIVGQHAIGDIKLSQCKILGDISLVHEVEIEGFHVAIVHLEVMMESGGCSNIGVRMYIIFNINPLLVNPRHKYVKHFATKTHILVLYKLPTIISPPGSDGSRRKHITMFYPEHVQSAQ